MTDEAPEDGVIGVIPAGFWRRVAAWVIDGFLVTAGAYLVGIFLWPDLMVETKTLTAGPGGARLEIVSYELSTHGWFIHGVAFWAYTALLESGRARATLGKRALRLRVTDLHGERVSLLAASLRCWPRWFHAPFSVPILVGVVSPGDALFSLYGVVVLAAIAACIAIAFTRRKQGLHDMLARCLVVRRPLRVI
ncbi:MAG: RDD family protein [Rhodospirillaceae bacterium]|nr:RDD family protein [Rhodospirillaceae bacterium]